MKSSAVKEILLPVLSLTVICLVCSVLLAFTNNSTKDVILQRSIESENSSKATVAPDASAFSEEKTVTLSDTEYTYFEALDSGSNVIGYVFTTVAKGYGGDVKVMTGIDTDGKITGVTPLTLNETPGLGMKAKETSFLSQFAGKVQGITVNKSTPGDNEIQALTGATITSKAVTSCVNQAFDIFYGIKEANGNG